MRLRMMTLAAASILALSVVPARGAERPFYRDVQLHLSGGLFRGGDPAEKADIQLYLGVQPAEGANWQWNKHLMGWAGRKMVGWVDDRSRSYNQMDHFGTVTAVRDDGTKIQLETELTINPDPWVSGGKATYALELVREKDGKIAGTFTGTFNGKELKGTVRGTQRDSPWPSPDAKYAMHRPGEHPRLIFRSSDLAQLRARAKTDEGRAILARLDAILEKPWTLWHPMGYAFKYQLTGDEQWAKKARQEIDAARKGRQQQDGRYSYTRPGGKLRAGSSYAAIAMAYDLCYDALEPEYRRALASEIQKKVWGELAYRTGGGQHSPRSNHYGAWQGGAGTAILAITGDEGTDPDIIDAANRLFRQRAKRAFYDGYGSKAYFFEGHHCGRLSTNTGLSSYLQALRVARGEDWITNYEPAQWLLTKWVYELVRSNGRCENLQRGMYARNFERGGMSSGGDFAQSLGICPDAHKPAVMWTYNHVVEPGEAMTYDAINYPHRAVYAFVNWPIELAAERPDRVLPRVFHDKLAEYYIFRSGWRGEGDIIVTAIGGEKRPFIKPDVLVLGRGVRTAFPIDFPHLRDAKLTTHEDGSAVLSAGGTSMAVDYSGLSGAPLVLAATGPGAGARVKGVSRDVKITTHTVDGRQITIMLFAAEDAPEIRADGQSIGIGKRVIRFDKEALLLQR